MNEQNLIIDPIDSNIIWKRIISNSSLYNNSCVTIIDEKLYSCDLDEIGNIKASSIGKLIEVSSEFADAIQNTLLLKDLDMFNIDIIDEKLVV